MATLVRLRDGQCSMTVAGRRVHVLCQLPSQAASGGDGAGVHQDTRGTPTRRSSRDCVRVLTAVFFLAMRYDAALPDGSEDQCGQREARPPLLRRRCVRLVGPQLRYTIAVQLEKRP